jgi:hypothetical protein
VVVMVGGDDDSNNCGDDGGYDMYSINNYSFTFFILDDR